MTTIVRSSSADDVAGRPAPEDRGDPIATGAQLAVLALGAAAGAAAGAHPAGWPPGDVLIDFLVAAIVTWAAARASTVARSILLAPAVLMTTGWLRGWALIGLVLIGLAAHTDERRPDRARLAGAAAGAVGVNVLLRLHLVGVAPVWHWPSAPTGSTALVGVVASAAVLVSAWRRSGPVVRRRMKWVVVAVAGYVALATVGFAVAALLGRAPMGRGILYAQRGLDAAERGNQPAAAIELQTSSSEFARAHRTFDAAWAWPARLVPVLGYYAKAAVDLAGAGHTVSSAGAVAALEVPYDRITAKPGQIDIQLLRSIVGPVTRADAGMRVATRVVDHVDTSWFIPPLMARFASYREHLDTALPEADRALEAVRLAPELLGSGGTRNYLVLFGNPAESRLLGGYAGAYGVLTASDGRLSLSRSGRTQDLPPSTTAVPGSLAALGWPVASYAPATHLGNITASDDFPALARAATSLFHGPLGQHIDGVMYVDPKGLAALLGLVGRVDFDGLPYPLNETNLAKFLVRDQYTLFPQRSGRFDFLSDTARQTFRLLTTRSLGSPMKLFQQLAPAVRGGHLLLWFDGAPTKRLLDEVGVSGRLDHLRRGDVFDLRTSNLSQNKTDAFLQRSVDYVTSVVPRTGEVDADVTIQLHNGAPRDLSPYVLSNQWLRAHEPDAPPYASDTLLVSVSTTMSLDRLWIDGTSTPSSDHATASDSQPDGVAHRYVVTVTVQAGATVEIRLRLHRPRGAGPDRVTFVHQPLANDDRVRVAYRSGTSTGAVARFTLTETRVVTVAQA